MDGRTQFRVLGPLQVRFGSTTEVIPGRRERTLLAALLLTVGEPVEVDRLIEFLWPTKQPRDATHALRTHVMRLRRHLGQNLIGTSPAAYTLGASPETVDAHRFDNTIEVATEHLIERRLAMAESTLADALDIWQHGAPWIDLAGSPVGDGERARLTEERLQAEERLAAVRLCLHHSPLDQIEKLALEKPLRENRWLLLMLALAGAGQQARALRHYAGLRTLLRDELGLDPDRRLQDMEHRILRQDPTLDEIDPLTLVFS